MHPSPCNYLRARDGIRLRYGFWRSTGAGGSGTVVVLGGRAEFLEKYQETIDDLLSRGFDVASMDWRGQGLSDRMLDDGTKGYVRTYDDYVSDLELFLETIFSGNCRRPIIIMAHSMGANIVLQLLSRTPHIVDKSVLLSPMIDIQTYPIPNAYLRWFSDLCVRLGMARMNIPTFHRNDNYRRSFRRNWLTRDPVRFLQVQKMLEKNSRLSVPNITYGWLAATYDAIDRLGRADFVKAITTPLLMVAAGRDRVVSNAAARHIAGVLPACRLVTITGAFHELLMEQDRVRDQFWQAFDNFV